MKLLNLLKDIDIKNISACRGEESLDFEINSVHYDTRDVKPGGLFVEIKGFKVNGHNYINEAIAKGAKVIITEKSINMDVISVEVKNTRKALASISARFYNTPSDKMMVIGITGTNGKTTITYIIENIFRNAGLKVGVIGTINYRYLDKIVPNPMTTPESLELQKILSEMTRAGITHVVMEVSSHAIDLNRIDYCSFNVGVFTNLSQDHLDFHKDLYSYFECKKKFFTEIMNSRNKKTNAVAVINSENEKGRLLLNEIKGISLLSVGCSKNNTVKAYNNRFNITGIKGSISTPKGDFEFMSNTVGKHNLENILCSVGVGIALDLPLDIIKKGIEKVNIPGRLEMVENSKNLNVFVDYAHTPDALENVLKTLKDISTGKIICIFGCGGDRDQGKRPLMGKIAYSYSDLSIITSDNPRSENPDFIIDQIIGGINNSSGKIIRENVLKNGYSNKGYIIEPDRKEAIKIGIEVSEEGDTVLIAGKGHETYQLIGDKTFSFDDRIIASGVLQ